MEDREASNVIETALLQVIPENENWEEGDMLVEWALIAYVANPNTDDSSYPMYFSNGSMATHHARGLLVTGLHMLEPDTE